MGGWTALEWLALVEYELLLFAGLFFLVGSLDELAVDGCWLWLKATGRLPRIVYDRKGAGARALEGRAAVLVPAWKEHRVIGQTISHALAAWQQSDLRIFVGVYRNDPATRLAVEEAARGDDRLTIVIHQVDGPTTKADCLNCLYRALESEETLSGVRYRMVLLHDAEDLVDAAALRLLDGLMDEVSFAQLPVLALPQKRSRWIGSHYSDEFAEAHGRTMVVRDALGVSLPAAGVGCAFNREILAFLNDEHDADGPFSAEALTEDYELGFRIRKLGGRSRFIRAFGDDGALIATRAWFPASIKSSVRQKARWVHGIAFQGWDRLGWGRGFTETWMRARDRRGPFAALILLAGYLLLALSSVTMAFRYAGMGPTLTLSPPLNLLMSMNLIFLLWRAGWRFAFTAHAYGAEEGLRSIARIPVSNAIAIISCRTALIQYLTSLRKGRIQWHKTAHEPYPESLVNSAP